MKRLVLTIAILIGLAAPAWGQDFAKGLLAYGQRDYATAAKWFRLAGEQGDPAAQLGLGHMYEKGLGVPHDHAEAVHGNDHAAAVAQHLGRFRQHQFDHARVLAGLARKLPGARRRRDGIERHRTAFRLGDDFLGDDQNVAVTQVLAGLGQRTVEDRHQIVAVADHRHAGKRHQ